ncbi:Leucine Rich repeats (2 copies) [Novipirellula artificiosorum]|uniref:Leucine Rich repeats (2 copies) n=2 Tax=Novipirellula artificiosorum TaxID=2528016 RepID=A0A5C6D3H5_9BACT|nr:Leucine Rich repeats (2 copies) [Novipirellula artificiosorum]
MRNLKLLGIGVAGVTSDDMQVLKYMKELREIQLGGQLDEQTLEILTGLPELESVRLGETSLTEKGLQSLGKLTKLRVLGLGYCTITGDGLKYLGSCSDLEVMTLVSATVEDLSGLQALSNLRFLDIINTLAPRNQVAAIQRALPECKIISDSVRGLAWTKTDPDQLACQWLISVGGHGTIVEFNGFLSHLPDGELGIFSEGMFCYLRTVDVADNAAVDDTSLKNLAGLIHLEKLNLKGTSITDACIPHFERLRALRWLKLTGTKLSAEGVSRIAAMLPECGIISEHGGSINGNPGDAPNFALAFDGKTADVELTQIEHNPDGSFTIEATVARAESSAEQINILSAEDSDGSIVMAILANGRPAVQMWERTNVPQSEALSVVQPGTLTHIAGVFDDEVLRVFVDGKLEGTASIGKLAQPSSIFYLGKEFEHGQKFDGTIDEIRISSTARYSEDFTPVERFEPDEHTLALYHCDEGTGGALRDSSGNGHDGWIRGATWVRRSDQANMNRADKDVTNDDLDRKVAEAVLKQGFEGLILVLKSNGEERRPVPGDALPDPSEPFFISRLSVKLAINDSSDLLSDIGRLSDLNALNLHNTGAPQASWQDLSPLSGLTQLEHFSLNHCAVTAEGVHALSGMRNLKFLGIEVAGLTSDDMQVLGDMKELRNIYLAGQLDEQTLEILTGLPELDNVSLTYTSLTDKGLQSLGKLIKLRGLDLRWCTISGDGLKYLGSCSDLEVMTLASATVEDLFGLQALSNLRFLDIVNTLAPPDQVAEIQRALPNCKIISDSVRGLAWTKTDPDQLACQWLISVGGHGTMVEWSGFGAHLPDFELGIFYEGMPCYLRSVDVTDNAAVDDTSLKNLAGLIHLEKLNLKGTSITDACIPHFERLRALRWLKLTGTKLSAEGVSRIAAMLPECGIISDQDGSIDGNPGDAPNFALAFDGKTADVELTQIEHNPDGSFTIEATVARAESSAGQINILSAEDSDGSIVMAILANGRPSVQMWERTGMSQSEALSVVQPGAHTHIAGVFDDEVLRVFVDGKLEGTASIGKLSQPSSIFHLGKNFEHGQNFTIDEIRISSTARYSEDFTPVERFEPDEHTLALYHCDEGTGGALRDSSGNGHDGWIRGATWVKSSDHTPEREVVLKPEGSLSEAENLDQDDSIEIVIE